MNLLRPQLIGRWLVVLALGAGYVCCGGCHFHHDDDDRGYEHRDYHDHDHDRDYHDHDRDRY